MALSMGKCKVRIPLLRKRFILVMMTFWSMLIVCTTRLSLSYVITKMVPLKLPANITSNECPANNVEASLNSSSSESASTKEYEFDWDEQLQGHILSVFYIGYIALQLPSGILALRFGGKLILLTSVGINAICTLLTPLLVQYGGHVLLIISRIIIGASEAPVIPCVAILLAAWFPLRERSRSTSFSMSGTQIGSIIGSALSGYLLSAFDGWSSVYYIYGGAGLLWCIVFGLLCYDDPNCHPFISEHEKHYLNTEMKQRDKEQSPTPWKAILSSPRVWAIAATQFTFSFNLAITNLGLAKYMGNVLKFPILENGLLCALPYCAMWVSVQFCGYLGIPGPPILMLFASFAGCNKVAAVCAFVAAAALLGFYSAGFKANNIDLSTNYVSILMSCTSFVGLFGGLLAPQLTAYSAPNSLMLEWRNMFWINVLMSIPTTIIYLIWARAEVQSWNESTHNNTKKIETLPKIQEDVTSRF